MFVRTLALAIGLLLGVTGSQLPEFAQQYRQRLGGALDELRALVERFDAESAGRGLSHDEAVARLQANPDDLVRERGQDIADTTARERKLERQQAAFATAGPGTRLWVMAKDYDPGIAGSAWAVFEPAVPVTTEGFLTAAAGLLVGLGLTHAAAMPFRRSIRKGDKTPRRTLAA